LVGRPLFLVHCKFIFFVDLKELFGEDGLVNFDCVLDLIVTPHLFFEKWFYVVLIIIWRLFLIAFFVFWLKRLWGFRQIELCEDIYEFITDLDF
jgi:hypothetical protein